MVNNQFACIICSSSADFGRTNLVEMDLSTIDLPVASKAYTIPLKYKSFVDEETKLAGRCRLHIKSLSDLASPICIIKKQLDPNQPKKLQLRMCVGYRNVNQSLKTTHNCCNGKVVSTFPLPKIQELLSKLVNCK